MKANDQSRGALKRQVKRLEAQVDYQATTIKLLQKAMSGESLTEEEQQLVSWLEPDTASG